jgi:hypothetical protein
MIRNITYIGKKNLEKSVRSKGRRFFIDSLEGTKEIITWEER